MADAEPQVHSRSENFGSEHVHEERQVQLAVEAMHPVAKPIEGAR